VPMQLLVREVDVGRIVVLGDRNVFKLGIILGPSRVDGKARVCSWSNAARSWSNPFTMAWSKLSDVYTALGDAGEAGNLNRSRRFAVAKRASASANKAPGFARGWGWL
jgi:hypothetical protein